MSTTSHDPLAPERDLTREEIDALFQHMRPVFRPRTVGDFGRLLNADDRRVRCLERRLLLKRVEVPS